MQKSSCIPIRKGQAKKDKAKYLNRHFTKGNIHVINKYEKMLSFTSHQGDAN